jgi:hypothetical protein
MLLLKRVKINKEKANNSYIALSAVIHKKKTLREVEDEVVKKKTLKEGEDQVVKRDSASSEKQTQNLDMLDRQDVEEVS